MIDRLEKLQGQIVSVEQLEENIRLIQPISEHVRKKGPAPDVPFEFRQRMLKLLVDAIFLDENAW